ncbi:flavodoxin [Frisingicoccus sp.]|uniref:flavodoxin n=1 Tax=Frisingicoccus sp. TaxID=1918627 RepID=UPI003AB3071E
MMKKTIAILLFLGMVLGLAACGKSASQTEQPTTEEDSVESRSSMEEAAENSSTDAENMGVPESQPEETDIPDAQESKVLIAYFSATGTTKGVAEHIANGLNADIYEIVPEDPYTDADLDYNNNNSRATIEMSDPDVRPVISGSVENMEQYDIVFIGYPIWWGEAPRIISTFVESYDFSGKTIVPFCTSGGSGMGSSAANLEELTNGAQWISGQRLSGSDTRDTVMEWVNGLGLNFE